ncbi:MAG: 50S ribosomal protein L25 [Parcubacteria group bacterium]|nr:50S ribosomal protein L25 [Parcubacteria group bacterium]
MSDLQIKAKAREEVGKGLVKLRAADQIPGNFYGAKSKPVSLSVEYLPFKKVFQEAGENTVIDLDVDGKKKKVLVKEVQYHPTTSNFIHIDFFEVDVTKKITAAIPLEFTGESKAVKDEGGVLVKSIDELEVECLPADLPKNITVDISSLDTFEDVIKVGDLDISAAVSVSLDKKNVIATVTPPRSEEELDELDEEVKGDVEDVEGVKKEEPVEGEEGAEEGEGDKLAEEKPAEEAKGADDKDKK